MNINFCMKINLIKPKKKKKFDFEPSAPAPECNCQYVTEKRLVCWWKTIF